MAGTNEWAVKHRPRKFEEVFGQQSAVETLSALIIGQAPRGVVITGTTGAGKTTLAKIYAQACLCERPDPSGSPCGVCDRCTDFERGYLRDFDEYPPTDQRIEDVRELVLGQRYRPDCGRRVMLFDEAGEMRQVAFGALNAEMEVPREYESIFIFTLINADRMPVPVRDRLASVVLEEPNPDALVQSLRRVCLAENLEFDEEGLSLIADTTDSFRRAVNDLQTVAAAGRITAETVHEHVLEPRFSWLVRYFRALAAGNLGDELKALEEAKLEPGEQTRLILGLINTLRLRFIGPTVPAAKVLRVVSVKDCLGIVDAFTVLSEASGVSLSTLWRGLMVFWSAQDPDRLFPEALQSQVMDCHDRMHRLAGAAPLWPEPASPDGAREALPSALPAPSRPSRRIRRRTVGALREHLDLDQASALYEAASFALQAYWAPFNASIRLVWTQDGSRDDGAIAKAASDFAHQLQLRLKGRGLEDVGGFHHLLFHQRSRDGRLVTTVIGHVPARHVAAAKAWLQKAAGKASWGATIEVDVDPPATSWPKAVDRHWDLVRQLWRGVDPGICVDDARSLLDALEVPRRRRCPAGEVRCRRFSVSDGVGPTARRELASDDLPHLSAVSDRAWNWLFKGWEWDEYQRRYDRRRNGVGKPGIFGAAGRAPPAEDVPNDTQLQIDRVMTRPKPWS